LSAISAANLFPQANTLIARFAGPGSVSRAGLRPAEPSEPAIRRVGEIDGGPRQGTMFQRNAEGDSATFSSRETQLTDAEREVVEKLKIRDQEVRRHEEAHRAAAGALFRGGPNYTFQTGPDGQRYAVGGDVQIDTSPGRTPEETVQKAAQIRRAALAPAEPSGTDRAVAARATRMEAEARLEMAAEKQAERTGESDETSGAAALTSGPFDTRGAATGGFDAMTSPAKAATRSLGLDVYA